MKTTVVVSCYNQEKYIAECLDSILNQSANAVISVLVADDCSTDQTPVIVQRYCEQHPGIVSALFRDKNLGAEYNDMHAHGQAEGDVIFHMDGDDVMLPGKIQSQLEVFQKYPDVNLVFHRSQYFSDDGRYSADSGFPFICAKKVAFFDAADLAAWGSITAHSAFAYRKTARKTYNPGWEALEWFLAMDALLPKGKGAYLDEILLKYRWNENGRSYLSSKQGRKKAYGFYTRDVKHYANAFPNLRPRLFANLLVTQLGMLRKGCGFESQALRYLCARWMDFRPTLFIETFRMRRGLRASG